MRNQVAITGMGVISPIGLDLPAVAASLREARSGIRLVQVPPIERGFAAGAIDASFEDAFTRLETPFLDRCAQMAVLAARQAVEDAGLPASFAGFGGRAGVYYGNVNGGTTAEQGWFEQMLLGQKQAVPLVITGPSTLCRRATCAAPELPMIAMIVNGRAACFPPSSICSNQPCSAVVPPLTLP